MKTRKNSRRRKAVNGLVVCVLAVFFYLGIMGQWSNESAVYALDAQTTLALETLERLYDLPDPDVAETSPQVKRLMKEKTAELVILDFAGKLKTGKVSYSTSISPVEREKALKILDKTLWLLADQRLGNKNQKAEVEEWDKLLAETNDNVGLMALRKMFLSSMRP